jgi:hypothetical protein
MFLRNAGIHLQTVGVITKKSTIFQSPPWEPQHLESLLLVEIAFPAPPRVCTALCNLLATVPLLCGQTDHGTWYGRKVNKSAVLVVQDCIALRICGHPYNCSPALEICWNSFAGFLSYSNRFHLNSNAIVGKGNLVILISQKLYANTEEKCLLV